VFAAKLLALQASGDLPAYSGDRADQIKLYTFGAPRVGSTEFAAFLEDNMRERYRWAVCRCMLLKLLRYQGCNKTNNTVAALLFEC
jgi:hypothetical protein